ncbi:MAG: helix-turn-helix domain-containing protein [Oscillospiraceae bacterium]|jgi:transcriptional regulator with XRE-family HTH domain|nr:helix-turn-helix domain-containing protein [Oscillospiraceae bacterium]
MTLHGSNELKSGRLAAGLTLEAAASRLGLSERQLARHESGEVKETAPDIWTTAAWVYKSMELISLYYEKDPMFSALTGGAKLPRMSLEQAFIAFEHDVSESEKLIPDLRRLVRFGEWDMWQNYQRELLDNLTNTIVLLSHLNLETTAAAAI